MTDEQIPGRKWYKKKRYIIPLGAFGLIIASALASGPSTPPGTSTTPAPQVKSNSTQQIPISSPVPTPVPHPQPTPAPTTKSNCDPNYSGCVPIASDVDCAAGNGNGPAYVKGPVQVIGNDIYDLDRDHDGIACE